ncbi:LMBR1-like membrane protein [Giardia muris]|uniref:LMBR1-like membrane protein n=1 Tax=Giardia muris TaxID=5742 RepID=A0A4Z1T5Y7_GIAMU|nr:LMBR1-like membrane protein [Giardia muris]|eukprot:TNJ29473.1 LMBR1-like membrane protein [Giardia muris]
MDFEPILGCIITSALALVFIVLTMLYFPIQHSTLDYVYLIIALSFGMVAYCSFPVDALLARQSIDQAYQRWMSTFWKVIYFGWIAFNWAILFFHKQTLKSGHWNFWGRLGAGMKRTLILYLVIVVPVAIIVGVLIALKKVTLNVLVGLVFTIVNTLGTFQVILVLGFGLVDMPKRLVIASFPSLRLKQVYYDGNKAAARIRKLYRSVIALREQQDLALRILQVDNPMYRFSTRINGLQLIDDDHLGLNTAKTARSASTRSQSRSRPGSTRSTHSLLEYQDPDASSIRAGLKKPSSTGSLLGPQAIDPPPNIKKGASQEEEKVTVTYTTEPFSLKRSVDPGLETVSNLDVLYYPCLPREPRLPSTKDLPRLSCDKYCAAGYDKGVIKTAVKQLEKINFKLRGVYWKLMREHGTMNILVQKKNFYQLAATLGRCKSRRSDLDTMTLSPVWARRFNGKHGTFFYVYFKGLRITCYVLLSLLVIFFSIIVLFSEIFVSLPIPGLSEHSPLLLFANMRTSLNPDTWAFFVTLISFTFVEVYILYALEVTNFLGIYRMTQRSTDVFSAYFLLGRVPSYTFPLGWNIMNMLQKNVETAYSQVMKGMRAVNIGGWEFAEYFPFAIIFVVLFFATGLDTFLWRAMGQDITPILPCRLNKSIKVEQGRIALTEWEDGTFVWTNRTDTQASTISENPTKVSRCCRKLLGEAED